MPICASCGRKVGLVMSLKYKGKETPVICTPCLRKVSKKIPEVIAKNMAETQHQQELDGMPDKGPIVKAAEKYLDLQARVRLYNKELKLQRALVVHLCREDGMDSVTAEDPKGFKHKLTPGKREILHDEKLK